MIPILIVICKLFNYKINSRLVSIETCKDFKNEYSYLYGMITACFAFKSLGNDTYIDA